MKINNATVPQLKWTQKKNHFTGTVSGYLYADFFMDNGITTSFYIHHFGDAINHVNKKMEEGEAKRFAQMDFDDFITCVLIP